MKKILFIAPASIPVNGPESICNYKIIKCLASLNYHLDVISKDIRNSEYPSVNNISDVNVSVHSIRVSNKFNFSTIFGHLKCFIKTGYIYKGAHWAVPAIIAAENLVKLNNYDYIFTRSSPSEIVGVFLARKHHIKLITNFNDPFPIESYPVPYGQGVNANLSLFNRRLIRDIVSYSFLVSFPSERLRNYTLKYFKDLSVNRTVITPHVVENNHENIPNRLNNKCLRIIYAGNICMPRDPMNFLLALKMFEESEDAIICVDFIGIQDDNFSQCISDLSLSVVVNVIPALNYIETLTLIKSYDIALIIEAPLEEGIFLPTKVVDYLQCGIAIAACSPSVGVLNDLYNDRVVDYFSNIDSVMSIYKMLIDISSDYDRDLSLGNRDKDISLMTMKSLADVFSKVLN